MSSLGERIKFAREQKRLLQSDLATLIPVKSAGVISNWEKDINKPDAEKIVKLCDVLNVSASFLLDYYGKSELNVSLFEYEHIKKYRVLDDHGKDMVDTVLQKEFDRCETVTEVVKMEKDYLEPKAAHERTDIEVTEEMRKHDDDIMNNDDFWK